jgi:hypothetical protein
MHWWHQHHLRPILIQRNEILLLQVHLRLNAYLNISLFNCLMMTFVLRAIKFFLILCFMLGFVLLFNRDL